MEKIILHLWYDKEAKEAANFYISIFEESEFLWSRVLAGTPSGDAEVVSFKLAGQEFQAISAGPYFKFNPSVSLFVLCSTQEEAELKWAALSDGGTVMMEFGEYPFSKKYGWVQDRFGLSWQIMHRDRHEKGQKIVPNFLFSGDVCGKALEAIAQYTRVFLDSETALINRYQEGEAQAKNAVINYAEFTLAGQLFTAMDNGMDVDFTFNEAISLVVRCKNQTEIDYYWSALSAVPDAEQCGWLKDRFGLSWQIVPEMLDDVMQNEPDAVLERVTRAFLPMKKFDLNQLEAARNGTN